MKLIVRLFALGVALVVVAALVLFTYLDSIVGTAIEEGGTYALGVKTRVGFVRLSPFSGSLRLGSLSIENPPGYDNDHFLRVGSGGLDVDLGTVREDTMVVRKIELDDVFVALEGEGRSSNVSAILRNLEKFESGKAKAPPSEGEGAGQELRVSELVITDVTARVDVIGRGFTLLRQVEVVIPEIRLANVGKGRSITYAELSDIVVKAILAAVLKEGTNLGAIAGQLQGGLRGLTGVSVDVAGAVTRPVEGVTSAVAGAAGLAEGTPEEIGDAARGVEGAARDVGEQAGKAVKSLGGLLGRGEDE